MLPFSLEFCCRSYNSVALHDECVIGRAWYLCKLHCVVRSYSWMSRRREWTPNQEDKRGISFRVSESDVR